MGARGDPPILACPMTRLRTTTNKRVWAMPGVIQFHPPPSDAENPESKRACSDSSNGLVACSTLMTPAEEFGDGYRFFSLVTLWCVQTHRRQPSSWRAEWRRTVCFTREPALPSHRSCWELLLYDPHGHVDQGATPRDIRMRPPIARRRDWRGHGGACAP